MDVTSLIFILGLDDVSGDKNTCNSCISGLWILNIRTLDYLVSAS